MERYREFFEQFPFLRLIGNTPLVRLDCLREELPDFQVFAKAEWRNPGGSLKDRPVMRMLLEAILRGELTRDRTVLDSSSGNAGIAYAMIGRALGYQVELVVPGNASTERKKRILAHGAQLTFTDPLLGYDEALRTCHRLYHENPRRYYLSNQYANADNWRAHYETTAAEILEQTGGKLTHFVAGVGTGGSITGIGRRLKEHDPRIRVICIMPESFPGIEGLKPLESPEDIRPEILDESVIDEKVRVTIDDAYEYCGRLARHGLFVGQSSGAYLKGVHEVGKREKKGLCVTVLCDIGERYFSTRLWD
jgi:cysteine synthase B